jgi:iron complex outermembrane recepter protein
MKSFTAQLRSVSRKNASVVSTNNYLLTPSKFLLILCLSLLVTTATNAQKITGSTTLPDGKPAEYATVLLLNAKDSTLAKGAVTDQDGKYEIEGLTTAGTYFLSASLVGYGKTNTATFQYNNQDITAPSIKLTKTDNQLTEITIKTTKPLIEVKADKMILNVEGQINSTGYNALELLQKAPGVMVDKDDKILLKGSAGVKIFIDGKPSQLAGADLAAVLKSINSSDIELIEIITNPSAKYEAAGNSGIINIKLKKNKKLGFNGNLNLGVSFGVTPKENTALGLNYRDQKWNLFSNLSQTAGIYHNDLTLDRRQNNNYYNQTSYSSNDRHDYNAKIGADHFINDKSTLGVIVSGAYRLDTWINSGKTFIGRTGNPIADSVLVASNSIPSDNTSINYNINYRFADTLGHELNTDADYGTYRASSNSNQPNYYKSTDESRTLNTRIFKNATTTDIDIATIKADYEQKLGGGKLGFGAKYANVITNNSFKFFKVDPTSGTATIDPNASNTFKYTENINALYLNYNRDLSKKISLQAGLRMENTNSEGNLLSAIPMPTDNVKRSYTDLFPSAALTYTINDKHSLNLTYSRRIDRPSYQDLNPFENKLDELAFQKGNPFLKPQYTNKIELTHTLMSFINTSIGYAHTVDLFTELIDTAQGNKTFIINKNINSFDNYTFNIAAPLPLAKWFNGFLNFSLYHSIFNADKTNISYDIKDASITAYNVYMENTITLPKDWSLQISGWYNSPSIWGGVWRSLPQGSLDLGFQKKILNGNGKIKVSYGDILNTAGWRSVSDFNPGLYMSGNGHWEAHQLKINFSYNFGNKEVKGARNRQTGLEDEKGRIK